MNRLLVLSFAASFCWGCQVRDLRREALQHKVDSLTIIVQKDKDIANTLKEVSVLLDSIDATRKVVGTKIDKEEGSYKEIASRMKAISNYVKDSHEKLALLDKQLMSSGRDFQQYAVALKSVQQTLQESKNELIQLQKRAELYDNQNQNLIHLVDLQKSEIEDKLVQLQARETELARLGNGVDSLLTSSLEDRGNNCFIRAQLLEEVANRTKLAPRKKRNTRLEALELYKMASYYGNTEATAKISALEKKI